MSATENDSNGISSSCTEEPSVTMVDVLEQEKEMEEEYAAVLGASDDKNCTYSKGTIKRQALYACLTCNPESRYNLQQCAGICLACSLHCHENHEMIELYTKRNFRCDCPTEKMPHVQCSLNTVCDDGKKMPANELNIYNHNFQGVYCTCKRPYPDPDNPGEEAMLQCTTCEDWYHMNHLDITVNKLREDYHEMICHHCMRKYDFIKDYCGYALKRLEHVEEDVNVDDEPDKKLRSELDKSISEIMNINKDNGVSSTSDGTVDKDISKNSNDAPTSATENGEPPTKKTRTDSDHCRRPKIPVTWTKGATFWPDNWRSALCNCSNCLAMYNTHGLSFLLDPEDSAASYEELGRVRTNETCYEQGMRALNTIERTKQIDAITEYNRMKDRLKDYLQTFVANKKVVTEADINIFFDQMKNEKTQGVGPSFFCR